MPQYSSSPLGLALSSGNSDILNNVGKYIISATSSGLKSLFSSNSYSFVPTNVTTNSNDISTTGIIEYTQKISSMSLKYSDFAYLKNLGVYTNNRLIIARRFNSPVADDLTTIISDISPSSTLVSWIPDNSEFISTEFGEEWGEADASFKEILNEIGHDTMMGDNKGKNLGDFLGGGANGTPLPGFTEGLQYEVFHQLGMSELDASNIPVGNPNIIRQAKRRTTIDKDHPGSGLHCKFKIDMTVEYEQKFINGVDPTIVYYDIIANALAFGTSEAQFQFKGNVSPQFDKFIDMLGSGDPVKLKQAMLQFVVAISKAIGNIGKELIASLDKLKSDSKKNQDALAKEDTPEKKAKLQQDINNKQAIAGADVIDGTKRKLFSYFITSFAENIGAKILQGMVSKYKIRIMGVVNSLTGTPSAPWHVTIGNPRKPIFSSGDMLVTSVTITMGKLLAFNDLPASIKLKFTLESSRNLGAQEIYKKLNCGKERTYLSAKTGFVESDISFSQDEVTIAKQKLVLNQISNSVITGSSFADRKPQIEKVFETNTIGLTKTPGIGYNIDTDDKPTATLGIDNLPDSLKNNISTLDPGSKGIRFDSDGLLFSTNGNKSKAIGNWTPTGDGGVSITTDSGLTSKIGADGTIK